MGTKYTDQSSGLSTYNSSPPADDGSAVEANKVKWSTIKTKLTDMVKTTLESVNTAITNYVDEGPDAKSANYTTVAGDHNKVIECSNQITITLIAVASVSAGYRVRVKNVGSDMITVTCSDGIDSGTTVYLYPNEGMTFIVNAGASKYLIESADLAVRRLSIVTGNKTLLPIDHQQVYVWEEEADRDVTLPNIGNGDVQDGWEVTIIANRLNGATGNTKVDVDVAGSDTWWDGNTTTTISLNCTSDGEQKIRRFVADATNNKWYLTFNVVYTV